MPPRSSGSVRIFYPRYSPEDIVRTLREGLPALLRELPLQLMVLFGSYARGNYTVASDVDLLLVYSGGKRPDDYVLARRILGIPRLELHIYTDAEYQKVKNTVQRWVQEGVVLWSKES